MEKIENQSQSEGIEGEYQFQPDQQKLFKNLSAASDFILSFGITNYLIRDGYTQDGKYVVQVKYQRSE